MKLITHAEQVQKAIDASGLTVAEVIRRAKVNGPNLRDQLAGRVEMSAKRAAKILAAIGK